MKRTDIKTYLSHAFMSLACLGAVTACVEEDIITDSFNKINSNGLSIMPLVTDATVVTRTNSDENLQEEKLNTLDVFVESQENLGVIMKQYHRTSNDEIDEIGHDLQSWLANNWHAEGLEFDKKYNIYVAVNNPLTDETHAADITTVAALKALIYNEVIDGKAIVNDANNIAAPWSGVFSDTPSGNIYKQYVEDVNDVRTGEYNSVYGYTADKQFMMDGVLKDWSPSKTTRDQVFQPVTLNRAAAKIKLTVNFDPNFLTSLTKMKKTVDGVETWVDKPEEEQITITGNPAWRFTNFAFGAPVFTPETQGDGVEVHNCGTMLLHPYSFEGTDKHFQIITYTYPNKWAAADYASKAPSIVISVPYTQNGVENFGYYRIPLVKYDVTAIERNTLYVINATIATRGSEITEDVDEVEDIYYKVVSWNNEGNEDQQSGDVTSVQHYYLQVSPKVYTLRGDGEQSVDIHFSRAKNTSVGYKLFTFPDIASAVNFSNNTPVNKTAVTSGGVLGWYFSDDKHMKTVSDGVTITNNNPEAATAESTEGTITVSSEALQNRAIKYILMRVYLKDENGNDKSSAGYYEDVLIRHFPTDNIQSDGGLWSSRTTNGWWSYSNGTGYNASGTKMDDYNNDLRNVFSAKYFYNNSYIRTWGSNGYYYSWVDQTHLDNPYKYIIQISSTSEQYVMGRPVRDDNYQSQDHVVSPAFMIASQLGATRSKSPQDNQIATMGRYAADHCRTYKEVDVTGAGVEGQTLWTGWRLPTREEVGVILKYQNANYDTMEPVLTGRFYWTLEGAAVATGVNDQWADPITWYTDWETRYQNPDNDYKYGTYRGTDTSGQPNRNVQEVTFIRCIRDMSATEIEYLNNWNTIIKKYQAKSN